MEKTQATNRLERPSVFSAWLQATRPKTLTAALVPFLAGTALAGSMGATLQVNLLISALLSAFCIQIGTNFINDAFDFKKGTDNVDRLGPKRGLQSGALTYKQMYAGGLFIFAMAFVCGIPLIIHGGVAILLILSFSVLSGYLYTGGPFPLAYMGLGDVFVIVFFGWVSAASAFWLQTGFIDARALLLGTQIGLLSTLLIAINNLRDVENDRRAGKKTLAVRFGIPFAKGEICAVIFLPYALNLFWTAGGYVFAGVLPWLTMPLAISVALKVMGTQPSPKYNSFLALGALLHLTFGVLLIIGFLI